jgi:hypothetical protein
MGFKKTLIAGISAVALSLPGFASAGEDFVFNWGATTEGFVGTPISAPVDELKFTAESVVVFNGPAFEAGTTFTDYVVLRIDQLFFNGDLQILQPYGPLFGMELTLTAELTGVQLDATNYLITGFNSLSLFYDGPLGGFTAASYANLATFINGQTVESATDVQGTGTNSTLAPDGVLDLTVALLDLIANGDFELLWQDGQISAADSWLGLTNSNNALCGTPLQTCASSAAAILALFGEDIPTSPFFHTRSDGSVEKFTVAEPGTLALLGLALVGIGFGTRRRRKAA